jgi:hypothetical protein
MRDILWVGRPFWPRQDDGGKHPSQRREFLMRAAEAEGVFLLQTDLDHLEGGSCGRRPNYRSMH